MCLEKNYLVKNELNNTKENKLLTIVKRRS